MPAMKVTPDAAMRARDVSRPHAEQLRWAEDAEANATGATDVAGKADVADEVDHWPVGAERLAMAGGVVEVDVSDSESPDSEDRPEDAGRLDSTRRRRVRGVRSSSRRGRPSR